MACVERQTDPGDGLQCGIARKTRTENTLGERMLRLDWIRNDRGRTALVQHKNAGSEAIRALKACSFSASGKCDTKRQVE